ncbi:MAG: DUF4160 domain-containing protein [Flavobacteriales bacterium]
MPKIFEYFGYLFMFYTNEHLPVHVHVSKQDRESKVELHYTADGLKLSVKKVKGKKQLTSKELQEAERFIHRYHLEILSKWNQVYIFGLEVKCEKIKKKV